MSAAIRRGWRKQRVELTTKEVFRWLQALGCKCRESAMLIGTLKGKPIRLMPTVHSSSYSTLVLPDRPGGGRRPTNSESHYCGGCGIGFRRTS